MPPTTLDINFSHLMNHLSDDSSLSEMIKQRIYILIKPSWALSIMIS